MQGPAAASRLRGVVAIGLAAALLSACGAGEPEARPTIGSPSAVADATVSASPTAASPLQSQWGLTGVDLPADWPDVPLPRGTQVVSAFAIGAEPQRTWTATFLADTGTALDLAEPIIEELRAREYVSITEYAGERSTNSGLFSFAAPTFAIYLVLGEDDGRPSLTITVRGTDPSASPTPTPATPVPATPTPTPATSPTS